MDLQKNKLQKFFRDRGDIPKDKVKYYIGWLNKFMAYYNGSLDIVYTDVKKKKNVSGIINR